ncbi:MAG: SPFH domain-containing protein [Phycisphaerales bacterium]|jgi:membrane protease subunit HflC|nr:SPFH domain-containing protein [Phycisphaerales bacterium]
MSKTITAVVALLLVFVLILFNTTFTVNFHEVAIKTRLGRPAGIIREPGLHFKLPFFIDSVAKLDTRQQFVKSPIKTVQTRDGQQVMVQAFMLWKVGEDDEQSQSFFNSYGSLAGAQRDLETLLQGSLGQVGGYRFDQLIGTDSKLPEAEQAILDDVQANATSGVVPISVGISRVAFPPKTTTAVMRRMSAVQETLANLEEARGNSEASTIKQRAQAQAQIIRDFAEQWAAVIEARGNQEATRYYEQMRDHADLAIFLTWLDTLRAGLRGSTTFVTDMTKAPFHLIDLDSKAGPSGIPQPDSKYIENGSGESQ